MAKKAKPQLQLGRPADRSLQAYKDFIQKMTQRIAPGAPSDITDDEWIELHKEFWEGMDPAATKIPMAKKNKPEPITLVKVDSDEITDKELDEILDAVLGPEDDKEKPVRVQFQKGVTSQEILAGIKGAQDVWAKKFPERAHRLYPTVWDKDGNRIQPKRKINHGKK
jgi:hypothetical protein